MHRLRHRIEQFAGPRWPRHVRLVIALGMASLGFICYHFRLTSARGFLAIGIAISLVVLVIRRALWNRSLHGGPPA
jgi:hypothetical protein